MLVYFHPFVLGLYDFTNCGKVCDIRPTAPHACLEIGEENLFSIRCEVDYLTGCVFQSCGGCSCDAQWEGSNGGYSKVVGCRHLYGN